MMGENSISGLAGASRSHQAYVNAEVPDEQVQRMNASEHAGRDYRGEDADDRRAESGVPEGTAPLNQAEPETAQFREVDKPVDPEDHNPESVDTDGVGEADASEGQSDPADQGTEQPES